MSISEGKIADVVRARKIIEPIIVQVSNVQSVEKTQDVVKAKIHDNKYQITTIFKLKDTALLKRLKDFMLIKVIQGSVHVPQNISKTLVVAISNFEIVDATLKKLINTCPLEKIDHLDKIGTAPIVRTGVPVSHQQAAPADLSKGKITPFSLLTTFGSKLIIKGRVVSKNDKFKYAKGNLFSFVLQDKDGAEIKATCFNDVCDEKFDQIKVGETYYITKADYKQSNGKGYRSAKMIDLDMIIGKYTIIQKSSDEVPMISSIVPIADLVESPVDATYDICAFLVDKGPEQTYKNEKAKVTLTFMDQSSYAVEVDFWNEDIDKTKDMENGVVYVLTSLKLKEFKYKTLTVTKATKILSNTDIEQYDEASLVNKFIQEHTTPEGITVSDLRYLANETTVEFKSGDIRIADQLYCLRKLEEKTSETSEDVKANVYGYFTMFKVDNGFCYLSCPDCKKKIVEGSTFCEKCQKDIQPMRRFIVRASIADSTSSIWVTIFDEEMKKIIGKSADEMYEINEQDSELFENLFKQLTFIECRFHLICKKDEYNGETRTRFTVNFIQVLDNIASGTEEMKSLERMANDMKNGIIGIEEEH
ncbi:replication protein A 70 kDa DNA-binding subunit [Entamoeba histolytica HM-3:IMSS]|uniref:Replication protein 70 kDa DNAbinding subunit, putative n=2 Tax=Entamoeba histolytica TaxID=5759 RepID=M2R6S0_ENTHI|nr:replication protein 70 kDa DNAbinding subunit, putative [Entamoeba histolytica KU27]EMS17034.1 replication protein A 70 kDa DNA-binding subunit [Entamoeba histolytica HM-3:IMSS]